MSYRSSAFERGPSMIRRLAANSGHTCFKTIASGMTGLKAEQTSLAVAGAVKDLQSGPSRMCGVSQHESVIERLQAKKSNWRYRPSSCLGEDWAGLPWSGH